jgi:hypothetical protein
VEDNRKIDGGLSLTTNKMMSIGRNSNICKEKSITSKEVMEGKHMTINGVLRVGKTLGR